ncbi:MAG: diacylglycerol kinase [Candidatus Omnitrophota bacterium]
MKNAGFIDSLNAAAEGFIYVVRTQRNMRIHFLFGILVLVFGIYINLSKVDLLLVCFAVVLVLVAEMVNTSVEMTVDLIKESYHPIARVIKDIAAGAVFLSAINAVIVGYIVFTKNMIFRISDGIYRIRQSPWHITFIVLIVVLCGVVLGKVLCGRGRPFRGGMPSGHAAFAFSIWTIIVFMTGSDLISVITFVLAFLVARSRVAIKVHSGWEVFAGAALGSLSTAMLLQMLR